MSAVDLASVPDAHDVNDEYFVENFLGHCHGLASAGQVHGLTGAGSTADHIRQLLPGGCRSVMGGKFRSMSQVLVANAAGSARALVDSGSASSESLWRFGVLQLLDDYDSVLRRNGVGAAAMVFAHEPALTGHSGLDAAYAALACWLAHRDGWEAPGWARHFDRVARPWWFVSDSAYGKAWALAQSPGEFRIRGVFITDTALARA